jgi:Protein of unknown function (DUF1664)
MAAQRVFATIGAGWTGALLYNNGDLVREMAARVGSLALASSSTPASAVDPAVQALSLQLAHLTQLLALQQSSRSSTNESRRVVAMATAIGLLAACGGTRLGGLLYVTRQQFKNGVSTIGATVTALGLALQKVKRQLAEQISAVQLSLDSVSGRVDDVASELAGAREDIDEVRLVLQEVAKKQAVTNSGVFFLCDAVRSAASKDGPQGLQELEDALRSTSKKPLSSIQMELETFTALQQTLQGM